MFKKISLLTLCLICHPLMADTAAKDDGKTYKESIKSSLEAKGQINGIQELPMRKLFFVEATQGTYIVSSDGRFVFEGTLKDVWHRKTIRTLSDAISVQRTPVSNLGFDPEKQLATFKIGNPELPRSGVAFVDPTSSYTNAFLKYLDEHKERYNWTIVLAPLIGGDKAMDRARRIWCAKDKELALQDLINGTSQSFEELKVDCPIDPLVKMVTLADVFQIQNLPHIIREDGLSIGGFPQNFDEWFTQP